MDSLGKICVPKNVQRKHQFRDHFIACKYILHNFSPLLFCPPPLRPAWFLHEIGQFKNFFWCDSDDLIWIMLFSWRMRDLRDAFRSLMGILLLWLLPYSSLFGDAFNFWVLGMAFWQNRSYLYFPVVEVKMTDRNATYNVKVGPKLLQLVKQRLDQNYCNSLDKGWTKTTVTRLCMGVQHTIEQH